MTEQRPTFCRVCEPACGLVATVDDGRLVRLEPDREHPITRGFACPKGVAGVEIHHDPDRLNLPHQRLPDGALVVRSWDQAIAGVADSLASVLERWGPTGVATYAGNPASFNSLLGSGLPAVLKDLGVTRYFNSGTQDCTNKYAASSAVYGTSYLHPIPDLDEAEVVLLIGSNWRASKASFISLPNPYGHLMDAARRGAKLWFVNPRVTESSDVRTGPTIQIVPDTDAYFLAAMLCEIDRSIGFDPVVEEHGRHIDELRRFVRRYPPERVASVCGIDAAQIIEVAQEFAGAARAAAHMSTGVNQGRQGTLAYWLLQMLTFVTGNLDEPGGNVPSQGYYDIAAKGRRDYAAGFIDGEFGRMRTGELPGGLLSHYILDSKEPVKALFVIGGNPLLSLPGEAALEKAFGALELLVVIDIYPTATGEYAHWLLPATDQFERGDIGISGLSMQVDPWVQFTPPVVAAQHERREEWWIFARLAQQLGLSSLLDDPNHQESKWGRVDHMLASSGVTRADLMANPRGLPAGAGLSPGALYTDLIQTPDGRLDCCPDAFGDAIDRCEEILNALLAEPPGQIRLISRRDSRMHNSWYANVPGMKRGKRSENRLAINPADAERLGIEDGTPVTVTSTWGEIVVSAELDEALRRGVVSLEHGWGLQPSLRLSLARPGVNVNRVMPHGEDSFDELSNQQFLTGVPVTVAPVAAPT